MTNPFTNLYNITRHFLATVKATSVGIYKLFVAYSFLSQRAKAELVLLDTDSHIQATTQYIKGISFFETGVGVYRGEFVIIRQLATDNPHSPRWVVHNLSFPEFYYLSSLIPKKLVQLAHFVQCGQRFYIQSKGSKNTNTIQLPQRCPYKGLYQYHQYTSEVYNDDVESQIVQCKVIEQSLKYLETQRCPFEEIL